MQLLGIFSDGTRGTLILHLPKNLLILHAIEQVVLAEFQGSQPCPRRRSRFRYRGGASLYPCTAARSCCLQLHQGIVKVLGQVQHAVVHVHGSVERQSSLVDLHGPRSSSKVFARAKSGWLSAVGAGPPWRRVPA